MKFISMLLLALQAPTSILVAGQFADTTSGLNSQSCSNNGDCPLIQCFIPPCPDNVCVDGLCQVEIDPPNPECVQDSDCPAHNCFVAPCDEVVCNGGTCELQLPSSTTAEENEDQGVAPDLSCGPSTCESGQICCNRSCGYCVDPDGGFCTEEFCMPTTAGEDDGEIVTEDEVVPDLPEVEVEEEVVQEEGAAVTEDVEDTEDIYTCDIDSDCPVINCIMAPCPQFTCDAALGECKILTGEQACNYLENDDTNDAAAMNDTTRRICPKGLFCCNDLCTQQICSESSITPFENNNTEPANATNPSLNANVTLSSMLNVRETEDAPAEEKEERAEVEGTATPTTDIEESATATPTILITEGAEAIDDGETTTSTAATDAVKSQSTRLSFFIVSSIAAAATSLLFL